MSALPVPTSLDSFLTTVRGMFSDNAVAGQSGASLNLNRMSMGEISEFIGRSLDMVQRNSVQNITNALETLDGSQHTLGVTVLLSAALRQQNQISDWDSFYNRVLIFFTECNADQIKYANNVFAELCHQFTDELIRRNKPMQAILPITKALEKLQPTPNTLTSVHSDLCKLCLASRCFAPALGVIRGLDFADIAKEATVQDAKFILLFFYYGGMILTAVKDYHQALYFYEVCITMPALAVSHIMLDGYKKFMLVHLISQGSKPKESMNLPKYTSAIVTKYFKQLSGPYNDLVNAFYSNRVDELQATAEKNADTFSLDQNTGLVRQVLSSQTKTIIKRLTKTFLTLSLDELATRIGMSSPKEAERLLVTMIEEGEIHATISQKDGMVKFDTAPSDLYNSPIVLDLLEQNVNGCIVLDNKINSLDEDLAVNPQFIKKSNSGVAGSSSAAAAAAAASTPTASSSSVPMPQIMDQGEMEGPLQRMKAGGVSNGGNNSNNSNVASSSAMGNGLGQYF